MAGKLRDFIPMYGGGPIGGPLVTTVGHPLRNVPAMQRQAIHPCAREPHSGYSVRVNNSEVLYRYGRGDEVVTAAVLEASPWIFKGTFGRIPQKMIQFLSQTRHPVSTSITTSVDSVAPQAVGIEDKVAYRNSSEYVDVGYELVASPPNGDGGKIVEDVDTTQDQIDRAAWLFNTQHRQWDPDTVPHDDPRWDDEAHSFATPHRHQSWAWGLTSSDDYAARQFGGRGNDPVDISGGFDCYQNHLLSEGTYAEGEIDTGASYYSEEQDESFPITLNWSSTVDRTTALFGFRVLPVFTYLSHFGYWIFDVTYQANSVSRRSDISFQTPWRSLLELQGSFGNFTLLDLYLAACQTKADSFFASNNSEVSMALPEFDLDVRGNQYGPDPTSESTMYYGADTGVDTPGYGSVSVATADPAFSIEGTTTLDIQWDLVTQIGTPSQTEPTEGNRPNFGTFYSNAPSS